MRLIIVGLALALTASVPLAASTQAPVTIQPLAPGEVLVEVNALGMVTTRADRATLSFTISGYGGTETEARSAVQQNIADVRAMLRSQGIADADIRIQPIAAGTGADMAMTNASIAMEEAPADMNAASAMQDMSVPASAQAEVVIRNVGNAPAIQSALMQRGIFVLAGAVYHLNDDSAPRRLARAQALQKARADAEAYAGALNMRVVRVVRVTERVGLDLLGMMVSESQLVTSLFTPGAMRPAGPDVQTMVAVGVDFALAPR
ncbi:MAG TPA: SIMPL domain-containing protein [Allosphingosinicella sp.]|nr:SIMPL domain-containing protein [Allosphingosinicella sp.]